MFNLLPLEDIAVPTTDWTGKILSGLIFIILASTVAFIFKEWTGAVSIDDSELTKKRQDYSYLDASLRGALPIKIILENTKDSEDEVKLEDTHYLDENKDWHTEARELLRLMSKQYIISEKNWHETESLYTCKYSNQDIAVFCCIDYPTSELLIQKINYLKRYCAEKEIIKILVMSKNTIQLNKSIILEDMLVEYISYDLILDSLIDFTEYFDFINYQFLEKEITSGDNLRLQDTYVIPKGQLISTNDKKIINNIEEYILKWTKDNRKSNHISLLGEYGQGKSVLSLKIAYEMIRNKDEYRIPIIIELRGKSPKNDDMLSIIASWSSTFDISAKAIEKLFYAGKLLIILEGFDEMDLIGDSHTRHLHFKRLLEFMRFEKSKVIITGRPNLFLDTIEMEKFLQFNQNSNQTFYNEPIHLMPLNKEQIENALRHTNEITKNEILNLINIKQNNSFLDLISRPSTLYQASIIWDTLDKKNINSASVINAFIKHSYRRQESKLRTIGKTGVAPILTINEREYFMIGIATGMILNTQYSNQINKVQLESIISKLYYEIPNEISIDDLNNIPLRKRLEENKHAIETVFNDVRTSGILVKDLSGNDSFKFAHKSFLEFLFALFFVHKILQKDEHYTKIVNTISDSLLIKDIYSFKFTKEITSFISSYLLNLISFKEEKENFADKLFTLFLPNKLVKNLISFANIDTKIFLRISFLIYVMIIVMFLTGSILPPEVSVQLPYLTYFSIEETTAGTVIFMSSIFLISFISFYLKLKLKKPILLWYETCLSLIPEEETYKIVSKKNIERLTSENGEIFEISYLLSLILKRF
ncbi:MAG: NACHT domain-containing protein [Arcobacter sp.]|uniref:NACHT domain-containing protein n=1 Tax=Arcobacter sp. TaxID=1872629 RepID=UPI003B000CA6